MPKKLIIHTQGERYREKEKGKEGEKKRGRGEEREGERGNKVRERGTSRFVLFLFI